MDVLLSSVYSCEQHEHASTGAAGQAFPHRRPDPGLPFPAWEIGQRLSRQPWWEETWDVTEPESARPKTLAEKLDYLFRVVRPRGRGEYTYREVAQAINDAGTGTTISASYLWQLRRGEKDNPTIKHIEAIARFFGVPATYFLDDEASGEIAAQLELLAAMRDNDVREIALRASDLSDAALKMIKGVIESTRQLEGLTDESER